MANSPYSGYDPNAGATPTAGATDAAGTPGQTDSKTTYAGPLGYAYDVSQGKAGSVWNYLDPGDFFGKKAGADVLQAGKEASARLQALSEQAWQRQMGGLQLALGSMNNYNGVLSNLYGVPTNYYDPSQSGGVQGHPGAGGGPGAGGAPAPQVPKQTQWNNPDGIVPGSAPPNNSGWAPPAGGGSPQPTSPFANPTGVVPGSGPANGVAFAPGGVPGSAPAGNSGWTDPLLAKLAAMLQSSGPATETRSGGGHF